MGNCGLDLEGTEDVVALAGFVAGDECDDEDEKNTPMVRRGRDLDHLGRRGRGKSLNRRSDVVNGPNDGSLIFELPVYGPMSWTMRGLCL